MARVTTTSGWQSTVLTALFTVLAVALVAKVVWFLLGPLIPVITSGLFLFGIAYLLFRRRP